MVISAVIEAEMTLDELTALDRQNYFSLISLYPNLIRGLFEACSGKGLLEFYPFCEISEYVSNKVKLVLKKKGLKSGRFQSLTNQLLT